MSALAAMRPEQVAKFVKAVCGGVHADPRIEKVLSFNQVGH